MPTESRSDNVWRDEDKDGLVIEHIEVKTTDTELLSSEDRARAEKRLVRLLDMRLLPTIILIYLMNYIDVRILFHVHLKSLIRTFVQAKCNHCSSY